MEKNPNVSGVMYFKPMLFKGQLYFTTGNVIGGSL